jgi:hypothetical protein
MKRKRKKEALDEGVQKNGNRKCPQCKLQMG